MRRFMAGILGLTAAIVAMTAVLGFFALLMLFFAVIVDVLLFVVPFMLAGVSAKATYEYVFERTRGRPDAGGYLDNTGFFVSVRRRRAQEALERLRSAPTPPQDPTPHDRQRTVQL